MLPFSPIGWTPTHHIRLLDQTLLPDREQYLEISDVASMVEAIRRLRVRGAPLLGVAAAMGMTLAVHPEAGPGDGLTAVEDAGRAIGAARPTAVNLHWAVERMRQRARAWSAADGSLHGALVQEAEAIWREDREMCERIGTAGLPLLRPGALVVTQCNAGGLATGGIGTALAPLYLAHARGIPLRVVVPETRPLLQGARLTAWELSRAGIPCTLITDNMAASRIRRGDVDCILVGADRIAANGDVANKIGTYALALAARAHGVPFYVAAPQTTFDLASPDGASIVIEERDPAEVRGFRGEVTAPAGVSVWNPAFDVTPAGLVTGYLTDAGLIASGQIPMRMADRSTADGR